MTFEEAFDYIRSLSSLNEEAIRTVLNERSRQPGSEFTLADENSGMSFLIRFTDVDGYNIEAVF